MTPEYCRGYVAGDISGYNEGYRAGRASIERECKEAVEILGAVAEISVSMSYDKGFDDCLQEGHANCEQEYQEGFREGMACSSAKWNGVKSSMQAEKSALWPEVNRLRANNETLRREISNLRIKLDAKG
jgi:hypothetical protein